MDRSGRMDRASMVKQWVGEITGSRGQRFRVFTTGDDKYYYFDPIDPKTGCSGCIGFPVLKSRIKRGSLQVYPKAYGRVSPRPPRRRS